jgi:hypothetical protein
VGKAAAAAEPALLLALVPLAGALAIWIPCLRPIDPATLSDIGLASALPYLAWAPLLLLCAGFFLVVNRFREHDWLRYLYLASLVLVLHATAAIDYETLRYPWAWKHLGVVDYIQRQGAVDSIAPAFAPYSHWPGFFAGVALIADIAGIRDLATPALWAPTAFNLLYLAILPMIYRSFTDDRRVVFGACWVFICGNWIGQDYFSPQALAYLFYLILLALCLRFLILPLSPTPNRPRLPVGRLAMAISWLRHGVFTEARLPDGPSRVAMTAMALILIAGITASHQLAPLVMISALALLTVLQRLPMGFLLFAIVSTAAWILFVAAPYVAVALPAELKNLATALLGVDRQLVDLSTVTSGQAFVSIICRLLTLAIAVAACLGGVRRISSGGRDGVAAALALAAVPLVAVTTYGGEVIFRVYLFALPFLALLAMRLFFPSPATQNSPRVSMTLAMFAAALAIAFVFANNGKDRQYAFAAGDIDAMRWLYETAPPDTLIIQGANFSPSQFRNIEHFTEVSIADEPRESQAELLRDPSSVLGRWLENEQYQAAFVVLTRNQKAYVEALGAMPPGALDWIEQALLTSPRFRLVRASGGTKIFALNPAFRGVGAWID